MNEHKILQLCQQVAEALSLAFEEMEDPALCGLRVQAVEPVRGASKLRVSLSAEVGAHAPTVLRSLARARGYLRRQVATEIHRKRAPELCFVLVSPVD